MDERRSLEKILAVITIAMESRRELVAFSRMEAIEMDQRAREMEREALEKVQVLLPSLSTDQQLQQVKTRLQRMDEDLQELVGRQDVQDRSRALERDDITWRAFEDICRVLGVN